MTGGVQQKVLHVTTVHGAFDVRIFHKQCVSLARAGFDVALLQRAAESETRNGVRVIPFPTYRSRWTRMTAGVWRATRIAMRERADVVHFHDAEFIWGAMLLKLMGRRIVYDVHEDVAKDLHDKAYLPRWSLGPLALAVKLFEGAATLAFDRIVAATNAIAPRFPPNRVTLVRNTPILGELSAPDPRPFAERSKAVVYLGGLAPFNGVEQMVRAMGELPSDTPVRLILGGNFPSPRRQAEIEALPGWDRVDYQGYVDRRRIPALFADARAGLVVYQPTPNIMESEPNKFFELLSAGLPIVASDLPIWRAFIERFDCGLLVDPGDPVEIARAIQSLVDNPAEAEAMGARGREAILSGYNWDVDAEALVGLYRKLLPRAASREALA